MQLQQSGYTVFTRVQKKFEQVYALQMNNYYFW
jgi:hypothetical protein